MKPQKVFHFTDSSGSSFWRTPESSNIKVLLDAGMRRHDGKLRFRLFATPSSLPLNSPHKEFTVRQPTFHPSESFASLYAMPRLRTCILTLRIPVGRKGFAQIQLTSHRRLFHDVEHEPGGFKFLDRLVDHIQSLPPAGFLF